METKQKLSDEVKRKFIKSLKGKGFKVKTDTGWSPIKYCHKTIKYKEWQLVTESRELKCADTHIIFRSNELGDVLDEVYVMDLLPGDLISTESGSERVVSVSELTESSHMYDLELGDENHRFYTNGILSHNSATTRAFILWYMLFNKQKVIAILANKLALAQEQLTQLKDSYLELPIWMQPGVVSWNKRGLELAHGTRVLAAATSPDGIRGYSIDILYLDEFAFIEAHIADEFIASVFPVVSSGTTTKIIITSCVTKDTYVFTNNGIEQVSDFITESNDHGGYIVPEYKVMGKLDEFNTGTLMHNEGYVDTLKIDTSYSNLECSLEHKLWTYKDGEYQWVRSKDLGIGDYVSVKYGMNVWGNDDINFVSTSSKNINGNQFNDITKLTPDVCYLLGLFLAEGNACSKSSAKNMDITCGDDITYAFDVVGLRYSTYDDLHYRVTSASFIDFIEYIGFDLSKKTKTKVIPKRLMQMSKECTAAMLQGIFDGDGCATKGRSRVSISLTSEVFIRQIRMLLLNFGILSTYSEGDIKPSELVPVYSYRYCLEICKYEHVKRYFNEIGFRLDRKQNIFDTYKVPHRLGDSTDVVPGSLIKLRELKKQFNIPHSVISFSGEHKEKTSLSRNKLIGLLDSLSEYIDVNEHFPNVSDDVIWTKINNITESKNEVYDFSLPNDPTDKHEWCHSVLYNGIVGHQTPAGHNHFYTMWMKAKEKRSNFKPIEIPWNAVPGRTTEWANEQRALIGEIKFNQEFLCISGDEYIDIRNKKTQIIGRIKIGDLYDNLHTTSVNSSNSKANIEYEILTPNGYVDFVGIRYNKSTDNIELTFSNGYIFKCTSNHPIFHNESFIRADELCIGDKLIHLDDKLITITGINVINEECTVYDVLDVDTHEHAYYTSGIISHNCSFIGSVSTLIDANYLTSINEIEPLKVPSLPKEMKVWELPVHPDKLRVNDWEYVASLDTGMGVYADHTVMQLFLVKSNVECIQVAMMSSNKLSITDFCTKSLLLLKAYHRPNLIIEQNGIGQSSIDFFISKEYDNMLHFDPKVRNLGLVSSGPLKGMACDIFKTYIQKNLMTIRDGATIKEMLSFGRKGKSWEGLSGAHDDHILPCIWVAYYLTSPLFYGNVIEEDVSKLPDDDVIIKSFGYNGEDAEVIKQARDYEAYEKIHTDAGKYSDDSSNKEDQGGEEDDESGAGLIFRG